MPEAVAYLTYSGLTKYEETAITSRVNPELLNSAPNPHQAFSLFQSAPPENYDFVCGHAFSDNANWPGEDVPDFTESN